MLVRVFVLADTPSVRRRAQHLLVQPNVLLTGFANKQQSWERVSRESMDLVVAERSALPEPVAGACRTLIQLPDHPELVILNDREEPLERAQLLSLGCRAVLSLDLADEVLRDALDAIIGRRRDELLRRPMQARRDRVPRLEDFVSSSPVMQKLLVTARRVASADTSLLILGATGVGKERLARAIHAEGPRAAGAFVAVNCSAIPEALVESELFGHERGAFTGAVRARRGYFELAHRGTLFLDEVGDLPAPAQAKLLRALQEHRIQPVGSEQEIELDVRIIAATNRDLLSEVEQRSFRRDLYYRLGVVTLHLPPLRDRREDIPVLVDSYREHYARHLGRQVAAVAQSAMDALVAYPWPGNVRELRNVLEHAVLLCNTDTITIADLPDVTVAGTPRVSDFPPPHAVAEPALFKPWREARQEALDAAELAYLQALLRSTHGHVSHAAKVAGISRRSIFEKMRRFALRREDFR